MCLLRFHRAFLILVPLFVCLLAPGRCVTVDE